MWFAAGARAWHYDWKDERWADDRDGHRLEDNIGRQISDKLGRPVSLDPA
jgi:frataxin-like iron-binding protein CyaY